MENGKVEIQEAKESSLLLVLWKNIIVIILATLIGLGAGIGVAVLEGRTTYTVSKRVMFVAKYNDAGNTAGNDMVLAKIYLPDAVDKIKSPLFLFDANEVYKTYEVYATEGGKTPIVASAISSSFGDKSLIFTISYTDTSIEIASNKLRAVIKSAQQNLKKPEVTVAKDATIREVENRVTIRENSNHANYVVALTFAGFVVGIVWVAIKKAFDNTVKDKDEMEQLTGISFLAAIADEQEVENRQKKRNRRKV